MGRERMHHLRLLSEATEELGEALSQALGQGAQLLPMDAVTEHQSTQRADASERDGV